MVRMRPSTSEITNPELEALVLPQERILELGGFRATAPPELLAEHGQWGLHGAIAALVGACSALASALLLAPGCRLPFAIAAVLGIVSLVCIEWDSMLAARAFGAGGALAVVWALVRLGLGPGEIWAWSSLATCGGGGCGVSGPARFSGAEAARSWVRGLGEALRGCGALQRARMRARRCGPSRCGATKRARSRRAGGSGAGAGADPRGVGPGAGVRAASAGESEGPGGGWRGDHRGVGADGGCADRARCGGGVVAAAGDAVGSGKCSGGDGPDATVVVANASRGPPPTCHRRRREVTNLAPRSFEG